MIFFCSVLLLLHIKSFLRNAAEVLVSCTYRHHHRSSLHFPKVFRAISQIGNVSIDLPTAVGLTGWYSAREPLSNFLITCNKQPKLAPGHRLGIVRWNIINFIIGCLRDGILISIIFLSMLCCLICTLEICVCQFSIRNVYS